MKKYSLTIREDAKPIHPHFTGDHESNDFMELVEIAKKNGVEWCTHITEWDLQNVDGYGTPEILASVSTQAIIDVLNDGEKVEDLTMFQNW